MTIKTEAQLREGGFSAEELMTAELPPLVWVVPTLVPTGLTLLAGKPKMGKSWLAMELGLAVATGGTLMVRIECPRAGVLYLALEDSVRRFQTRLSALLQGKPAPANLFGHVEWPRMDKSGLERLDAFLLAHADVRLVIVDTLAKVRTPSNASANAYAEDYAALAGLKRLADTRGVAMIVIHHLRKMRSEDPFEEISGTNGLTGAADTIMVLARKRNSTEAVLHVTGRDLEEKQLSLSFHTEPVGWELVGDVPGEPACSEPREAILAALSSAAEGLTPKQVARLVGRNESSVRYLLRAMLRDGQISQEASGRYCLQPTNSTSPSQTPPTDPTNANV